jgi:hypothetical protein
VRLPNPNEQERQHALKMDTQDTFRIFAEVTGGRAYTNTNDFENAYRESMDDSAAYYLLGYYVDRKQDKEGWHELNVKLSRPATEVRSRRGFILRTSQDKNTQEQEIDTAIRAPLDYTGIPIAGRVLPGPSNGSKRRFKVSLLLPPGVASIDTSSDNHLDLAFLVRIQAPDGTTVAHSAEQQEGHLPAEVARSVAQQGVRYEHDFELAPGLYSLHIVVRDNLSGRIGSVNSELTVPQAEGEAK